MTGEPERSSLSAHLLVRGEPHVVCHTYADHNPILSISTTPTDVTVGLADAIPPAAAVSFAHALVSAAKTFLAQCERLAESGESAA